MWYGNGGLKILLSAIVAGVITWGGAFTVAATGATPITRTQVVLAVVAGVVAACKDLQSYLAKSPINNGSS